MRTSGFVITAALAVTLSVPASAQNAATSAAVQTAAAADLYGPISSHWVASGFVGSNFGDNSIDSSITFGGQIAYLWRGLVGAEALGDFAPSFKIINPLLAEDPRLQSFMANAIAAVPIGAEGHLQPYVSGGFGSILLSTKVFDLLSATQPATLSSSERRMGFDFGGGFMAFAGKVGFRADVRYYKASDSTVTTSTAADEFTQGLLSDLNFWRANGGVSFRW